jgi:dCMP deaminase
MKDNLKKAYMKTAETFAELSYARRLHVGAIIVKDDRIISIGYNGMPAGWENDCENKVHMDCDAGAWLDIDEVLTRWPLEDDQGRYHWKSKPEVLHAETNAIAKLAKSTESGANATMFITHSPCLDCAKLIYQSGITSVFYRTDYRSEAGVNFLRTSKVTVEKLEGD